MNFNEINKRFYINYDRLKICTYNVRSRVLMLRVSHFHQLEFNQNCLSKILKITKMDAISVEVLITFQMAIELVVLQ